MSSPAPNQPLQDETYLPDSDAAEIIDFLSALRDHGREAAEPRGVRRRLCRRGRAD